MKKPHKAKPKRKRGSKGARSAAISVPAHREAPDARANIAAGQPLTIASLAAACSDHAIVAAQRTRAAARLAAAYLAGERQDLALLLLPVFIVAFAVAVSQALRPTPRYGDQTASVPADAVTGRLRVDRSLQNLVPISEAREAPTAVPTVNTALINARAAGAVFDASVAPSRRPPPLLLPAAARVPPVRQDRSSPILARRLEPSLLEVAAIDAELPSPGTEANVCMAEPRPLPVLASRYAPSTPLAFSEGADFGVSLAQAARSQTADFIVYNDRYRRISYPMGDISALFGVCTDLVVRAYRMLGIDLQTLVYQQRSGSGDTNIDHRRTEILRRFFAEHGERLPTTDFHEDYRPGDIVTYYRPQNRRSRSHIAIVADVNGPSGRPMIVHNRGWGPQIEDALFVDIITGHYRFSGHKRPPDAAPAGLALISAGRVEQVSSNK